MAQGFFRRKGKTAEEADAFQRFIDQKLRELSHTPSGKKRKTSSPARAKIKFPAKKSAKGKGRRKRILLSPGKATMAPEKAKKAAAKRITPVAIVPKRPGASENPYLPKPYRVLDYVRESPDTFTIAVDMKTYHDPGQFVQVSLPGFGESPISICSDSREFIRLNIREVGTVTKALAKLKVGDTVLIRGPYGRGYPMQALRGNDLIIIGGGCGVAPLKGIIDYVYNHRAAYKDIYLFLGYRSPDDILFQKELEQWKKDYHVHMTVDENKQQKFCYEATTGFVTDKLKAAPIDNHGKVAFVCGPPIMMKFTTHILKEKGFNDDQIFVSAERLMYCALGVCCHCMIRGKFTCMDGPVFRYDEIGHFKND